MRRRSLWCAAAIAVLVLGTAGCGDDADEVADEVEESARDAATTVQSRVEGATRFQATLTGSAEVPGPGDPDGTGTASINIDVSKTEVCYEVAVQKLDRPTAMHIHEGDSGKAGDPVVTLTAPRATDTTASGCANADAGLLGRLTARPNGFYVNVHTDTYPQGAIRGQLSQ